MTGFNSKRQMAADKLQEPAQEPAEWLTGCPTCGIDAGCDCDTGTWNPPQRKPLTDEEIKHIYICTTGWSISDSDPMLVDFAQAIEAAHGIKEKNT